MESFKLNEIYEKLSSFYQLNLSISTDVHSVVRLLNPKQCQYFGLACTFLKKNKKHYNKNQENSRKIPQSL